MRLSFTTQSKIEFLLLFTGCRKVLGKMPAHTSCSTVWLYQLLLKTLYMIALSGKEFNEGLEICGRKFIIHLSNFSEWEIFWEDQQGCRHHYYDSCGKITIISQLVPRENLVKFSESNYYNLFLGKTETILLDSG